MYDNTTTIIIYIIFLAWTKKEISANKAGVSRDGGDSVSHATSNGSHLVAAWLEASSYTMYDDDMAGHWG